VVDDSAGNEDDSLLELDAMFVVDSIVSEEVVSVSDALLALMLVVMGPVEDTQYCHFILL
jgi:hypothetical protein